MVRKNRRELLGGSFFAEYIAKTLEKYRFKFILFSNIIKIIGILDKNLKLLNKKSMDL